jgi:hypothetical protein
VEALAQGDEGESPGEVENPGEHRVPGGLNRYLEATDSRGEKGPEDEPLSRNAACLYYERAPGLGPGCGKVEGNRSGNASPAFGSVVRGKHRTLVRATCPKRFQTPAPCPRGQKAARAGVSRCGPPDSQVDERARPRRALSGRTSCPAGRSASSGRGHGPGGRARRRALFAALRRSSLGSGVRSGVARRFGAGKASGAAALGSPRERAGRRRGRKTGSPGRVGRHAPRLVRGAARAGKSSGSPEGSAATAASGARASARGSQAASELPGWRTGADGRARSRSPHLGAVAAEGMARGVARGFGGREAAEVARLAAGGRRARATALRCGRPSTVEPHCRPEVRQPRTKRRAGLGSQGADGRAAEGREPSRGRCPELRVALRRGRSGGQPLSTRCRRVRRVRSEAAGGLRSAGRQRRGRGGREDWQRSGATCCRPCFGAGWGARRRLRCRLTARQTRPAGRAGLLACKARRAAVSGP